MPEAREARPLWARADVCQQVLERSAQCGGIDGKAECHKNDQKSEPAGRRRSCHRKKSIGDRCARRDRCAHYRGGEHNARQPPPSTVIKLQPAPSKKNAAQHGGSNPARCRECHRDTDMAVVGKQEDPAKDSRG